MPNAREKILDRLLKALRDERLTCHCYRVHCEEARRAGHGHVAERLAALGAGHDRHAVLLAARIRDLGGEPRDEEPPPEVIERFRDLPRTDLCRAIEHDLKTEDTQLNAYSTLAEQSDERTAELLRLLTDDDRHHAAWLREELARGWKLDPPL
jgi:bacterioferritin (cytochrome b1)